MIWYHFPIIWCHFPMILWHFPIDFWVTLPWHDISKLKKKRESRFFSCPLYVKYNWAKISSVPDTSVTYFVLQSLNQFTDETKQCMPVQINSWAKFCSTISFWYAVWFFELSWDKGCVSSGHLKYHAKKNRGKKNITAKPFKYLWYHQLVTFICTSFQYLALFWNPISIPI